MQNNRACLVFTGGGTAGHVMPNLALIESLQASDMDLCYIGSTTGIEKNLIEALKIPYYAISTGKLRRYWTWQHLLEPWKVIQGLWQAYKLLGKLKPKLVFSKGGFVSFPVVVMAWMRGIPVVAHESDMTPGLANRLALPFVKKFCINFPQTKSFFKDGASVYVTGTPIRKALLEGDKTRGYQLTGFTQQAPVLMVIGGSMGAKIINQKIREVLPDLLTQFQVIHLCGKGNLDTALQGQQGYCQLEFVQENLGHLFAITDIVVSRSGANALYEILTLAKPHVLIPLSKQASRGDQIENAEYFAKQGISTVVMEEQLDRNTLLNAITKVYHDKEHLKQKMENLGVRSATEKVKEVMLGCMS